MAVTEIRSCSALAAILLAGFCGPVFSQQAAPASPHTVTGNVGVFSQYIFRGLTQTNRDPALQGGFDYAHSSGFYLGTWASNISWLRDNTSYSGGGSLEWDFYGGYKGTFGKSDFSYDVGLLYYWYPGTLAAVANNIKADTFEVYGKLGWKFVSAKWSYSLMSETFGVRDSRGTWYLDVGADIPLGESGLTANLHWGYQKFTGTDVRNVAGLDNNAQYSYKDVKLGLSYALPKDFTIGAFYSKAYDASRFGYGAVAEGGVYPKNIAKDTFTVFLQKTF